MKPALRYPDDRHNGYVLLTDKDGVVYVPEFPRWKDDALAYSRAVMEFMRRLGTPNPFGE